VDKELLWGQVQEQIRRGFLVATRACFLVSYQHVDQTLFFGHVLLEADEQ
jgi:hypothetical protein